MSEPESKRQIVSRITKQALAELHPPQKVGETMRQRLFTLADMPTALDRITARLLDTAFTLNGKKYDFAYALAFPNQALALNESTLIAQINGWTTSL